jgi:hypothetical protein
VRRSTAHEHGRWRRGDDLELWIPAEELEAMNAAIVGRIEVIAEFHGDPPDGGGSGG